MLGGNSAARVGKRNIHVRLVERGSNAEDSAGFHRLEGIPADVVKSLLDLVAVEVQRGQVFRQIGLDENIAILDLGGQKM